MIARTLLAALIGFATLAPASHSSGQDSVSVPIHATETGETKDKAVREAYYTAFKHELANVVRYEEAGKIGASFRADFERDFVAFKSRYFSNTRTGCAQQEEGYLCEVDGTLDFGALQTDVEERLGERINATTGDQPTFALSGGRKDQQFVVGKLKGAFANWGLSILLDANDAIAHNKVDFALGIHEVTLVVAPYDPYTLQLSGTLTVQFELSHLKSNRVVATVNIVARASESGPEPTTLREPLIDALSKKAADEIASAVNERIVRFKPRSGAATER